MATKYQRQIETAFRMIEKFGRKIEISTTNVTTNYNPVTDSYTAAPVATIQRPSAVGPFTGKNSGDMMFGGGFIIADNPYVIVEAASMATQPSVGDRLKMEQQDFKIVKIGRLAPDGTDILYIIEVASYG